MKQIFSKKIKRDHKLISIAINNKHPETKFSVYYWRQNEIKKTAKIVKTEYMTS